MFRNVSVDFAQLDKLRKSLESGRNSTELFGKRSENRYKYRKQYNTCLLADMGCRFSCSTYISPLRSRVR